MNLLTDRAYIHVRTVIILINEILGRRRLDRQQALYSAFLQGNTMAQEHQTEVEGFHAHSKRLAELSEAITAEIRHKAPEKLGTGRVIVSRSRAFGLALGVLLSLSK